MKRDGLVPLALLAWFALAWSLPAYATGNCSNGKTLFNKTNASNPIACSNSNCHGTGVNKNDIQNAAGNPGLIDQALDGPPGDPGMLGIRAALGLTYSDLDDIATWIFYAPSCPVSAPVLQASPAPVMFGSTNVGSTSAPIAVTVTNVGGADATGVSLTNSNAAEFPVSGSTCSGTLTAGGGTCSFNVAFKPSASGARSASITVNRSGGAGITIGASGTGSSGVTPGQLSIPASVNFGSQSVGTTSGAKSVTITNIGGAAVSVSSISSSNPSEFTVTSSTCATVNPSTSCSFSFTFKPGAAGLRSAALTVVSNGTGSPQTVNATGTGTSASGPQAVTVVEYYHAAFDHYFITSIADEITKLDNGTFVGWARTGYTFKAYAVAGANTAPVCRFFSTSFAPKSSHFYTTYPGCTALMSNPDWQFEAEVLIVTLPAGDGTCAAGLVPVYRLYNNGQGGAPNHRYTTDASIKAQMLAKNYVIEGNGPGLAFMCTPP